MTAVLPSPSDHLEMPKRMVGRRVVRTCSCGKPWPCEQSAAERWTALRDKLTVDAAPEQRLGDDYSEIGTEESLNTAYKHWGKAEALREVLAWMDRTDKEAGR